MKKDFKLIKIYPGSPKLGFILGKFNAAGYKDNYYYLDKNTFKPNDFPDNWEEVIEKEYEILSYIFDNIIYKFINNLWQDSRTYILENAEKTDVHSVKRLSDNRIFTIGDRVKKDDFLSFIITRFEVDNIGTFTNGYRNLKDLTIVEKKPLFTTEDGVNIFEGDEVWGITKGVWKPFYRNARLGNKATTETWKYGKFSTKKIAEEYILMNKPILSILDVEKAYTAMSKRQRDKLKVLVKQTI